MNKTFQAQCTCGRVHFEAKGESRAPIACYCNDCRAVAKQIDAMPAGKSGVSSDRGTVSTLFRKDRVRCTGGSELLIDHKLRPNSPATRVLASGCNSNTLTKFDNWLPMVALRTYGPNAASVVPAFCINTRWARQGTSIQHAAPRHPKIPPRLGLKVAGSVATAIAYRRRPHDMTEHLLGMQPSAAHVRFTTVSNQAAPDAGGAARLDLNTHAGCA
jgi:hypothetical protein